MSQRITLRAATPADIPFLSKRRKLTMTSYLLRTTVPIDDETHYKLIRSNFEDARVICTGNESIGLLKLSRTTGEWHLHQIQVLSAHQGKGIGKFVPNVVLDEASLERVPISLSVLHGNPAHRLYRRLGFRLVAKTSIDSKLRWYP